jgi:hypothetical protein
MKKRDNYAVSDEKLIKQLKGRKISILLPRLSDPLQISGTSKIFDFNLLIK